MQEGVIRERPADNKIQLDIRIDDHRWPEVAVLNELVQQATNAATICGNLQMEAEPELSLLFTDDQAVREINRQWREIDKPTNVLSFPDQDLNVGEKAGAQLGDICFAFETITREASLEGKSLDHHLSHLVVHGFLHLFGYDHLNDADAHAMECLEIKVLAQLGISNPYL